MSNAYRTKIGEILSQRMSEKSYTIHQLADVINTTYEQARRLVKGEAVPPQLTLQVIAEWLELEVEPLLSIRIEDSLRRKYKELPASLTKKDPTLEPLERLWGNLRKDQRDSIVDLAKSMSRANRLPIAN